MQQWENMNETIQISTDIETKDVAPVNKTFTGRRKKEAQVEKTEELDGKRLKALTTS